MKNKILVAGLIVAMVLGAVGSAAAVYDASTPWTGTVKWIVPSDTAFSITFAGGESTIDFDNNLTSQTQSGVQPDSQNNATSTPIITITNDGNLNLNFTCNLTATKPDWAVIKQNNETSYTGATTFDTTAVVVNASVPASQSTSMYIWTDVTSAPAGTTERTLQINSAQV